LRRYIQCTKLLVEAGANVGAVSPTHGHVLMQAVLLYPDCSSTIDFILDHFCVVRVNLQQITTGLDVGVDKYAQLQAGAYTRSR
jgi:hypothetical protein